MALQFGSRGEFAAAFGQMLNGLNAVWLISRLVSFRCVLVRHAPKYANFPFN